MEGFDKYGESVSRIVRCFVSRRVSSVTEKDVFREVPEELCVKMCEYLSSQELGRFARSQQAFARLLIKYDDSIWRPACLRHWLDKRYNPLDLYPSDFKDLSWRDRFIYASRDGARRIARTKDVQNVKIWRVIHRAIDDTIEPYHIDHWPYRTSMLYLSPTFAANKPAPYTILEPEISSKKHTYIQVSGLPRIRVLRAPNWGWLLINDSLILESILHLPQPSLSTDGKET